MHFHYDLTQAEPILRDIPVYANAAIITKGTPMESGVTATEVNNGRAIVATGSTLTNIIGVTNEEISAANATAVLATGFETYAKHIINPLAVYLTQYATSASYDVAITTADSTGKSVTSSDQGNANMTGYWVYITNIGSSVGGYGNLFCSGAVTSTTAMTAVTSYDDNLSANIVNDTFISMHPRYGAGVAGGNIDLVMSTTAYGTTTISGQVAGAGSGAVVVLENYIQSKARPLEPLVISRHSGYNYKSEAPTFWADVFLPEQVVFGTYTRAIT